MTIHQSILALMIVGGAFGFQDPPKPAPKTGPDYTVAVGRSIVVTEIKDIKRIAIGDPAIVGDVLITPREFLLNAKKAGDTNIIVWYADDSTRHEMTIHVEHDLSFLRELLAKYDPSLTAQTTPDGASIAIKGELANLEARLALEADLAKLTKVPLFFQITTKVPPLTLDQMLTQALQPFGAELKIRRIAKGPLPNDATDTFLVEGMVATQATYTQALVVLDKMLGGTGADFTVVANEGGGLHTAAAQPQAAVQPGATALTPANLNSNFGRAVVIKAKNDRWFSFVRVRSLPQVLVAVRILVLDRTKTKDIGISWDQLLNTTAAYTYSRSAGTVTQAFTLVKDAAALSTIIRVLETQGYVRTLSEPNLVTMSGEVATFLVGGDVPIQQVVATSVTSLQGTEFRQFGINLTVRPVVGEDGRTVTIDALPDITEVNAAQSTSPNGAPGFRHTSLRTTAQLKDGEGILLGGLITTSDEDAHEQIPGLGDIPILGMLFGRTVKRQAEKELAIVLMPRIVYPKPASSFALEVPPADFEIRPGVFHDPELGTLKSIPDFYHKNIAEGERIIPGQPK